MQGLKTVVFFIIYKFGDFIKTFFKEKECAL